MKKDFGVKTWLYPMPVLMIATFVAVGCCHPSSPEGPSQARTAAIKCPAIRSERFHLLPMKELEKSVWAITIDRYCAAVAEAVEQALTNLHYVSQNA